MKKIFFAMCVLGVTSLSFLQALEAEVEKVIILGGGIGGLTSAIYAGRAGMRPLVIEGPNPGGAITQSHAVQNWPGELEIAGRDLMHKVREQAVQSGAEILQEELISVDLSQRPFLFTTQDSLDETLTRTIKAESCIIALGASPKFLGIPGELGDEGYWLRGVYNCAVCDGALFRNKVVAVVGGGDAAIVEAHYLSHLAKKVYLLVRKDAFKTTEEHRKREVLSQENVEVRFLTRVEEILGDGKKVTHLLLHKEGEEELLSIDGLFLAIGSQPNSEFFEGELALDKYGYIKVENGVDTSLPGVFAIGDIADPTYRQAISAAADGMKAAFHVEKFLVSLPKKSWLSTISHETMATDAMRTDALEITSVALFEEILNNSSLPILIDFYAPWCVPCAEVASYLKSATSFLKGKMQVIKLNIDKFPQIAERYEITTLPSLVVVDRQGRVLGKRSGKKPVLRLLLEFPRNLQQKSAEEIDLYLAENTVEKVQKPKPKKSKN